MDKGEFWKHEFEVLPASNGSFIVTLGNKYISGMRGKVNNIADTPERWAFSTVQDLLAFLADQVAPVATSNPESSDVKIEVGRIADGAIGHIRLDPTVAVDAYVGAGGKIHPITKL